MGKSWKTEPCDLCDACGQVAFDRVLYWCYDTPNDMKEKSIAAKIDREAYTIISEHRDKHGFKNLSVAIKDLKKKADKATV